MPNTLKIDIEDDLAVAHDRVVADMDLGIPRELAAAAGAGGPGLPLVDCAKIA